MAVLAGADMDKVLSWSWKLALLTYREGWSGFCALQTGLNCRILVKGYSLPCNVT